MLGRIAFEAFDDTFPLLVRDLAVVFQRAEAAKAVAQSFQAVYPLAEDDRLLPAGRDLFQVGFQSFQFAARARGGIEIADLFQPQHQFEHVLDCDAFAHVL